MQESAFLQCSMVWQHSHTIIRVGLTDCMCEMFTCHSCACACDRHVLVCILVTCCHLQRSETLFPWANSQHRFFNYLVWTWFVNREGIWALPLYGCIQNASPRLQHADRISFYWGSKFVHTPFLNFIHSIILPLSKALLSAKLISLRGCVAISINWVLNSCPFTTDFDMNPAGCMIAVNTCLFLKLDLYEMYVWQSHF